MSKERRPCACRGGDIEADPADEEEVGMAVREHQQTYEHVVWRAKEQLAGNIVSPMRTNLPLTIRRVA